MHNSNMINVSSSCDMACIYRHVETSFIHSCTSTYHYFLCQNCIFLFVHLNIKIIYKLSVYIKTTWGNKDLELPMKSKWRRLNPWCTTSYRLHNNIFYATVGSPPLSHNAQWAKTKVSASLCAAVPPFTIKSLLYDLLTYIHINDTRYVTSA